MKRPSFKIGPQETIVTAFPRSAFGPGWSNWPVMIVVRGVDHVLRIEYLQPDEQGEHVLVLYKVCQAAAEAFTAAVMHQFESAGRGR